jgi:hypothetical protein
MTVYNTAVTLPVLTRRKVIGIPLFPIHGRVIAWLVAGNWMTDTSLLHGW